MPIEAESKTEPSPPAGTIRQATPEALGEAGRCIRAGALVAFPTETVYGLGADATNALAVARIFEAKGRPRFNPLIVHVSDAASAEAYAEFTDIARKLAAAFWPGPLTLVVPRIPGSAIAELASAGLATLAIRVPDNTIAQALLTASGRPLAAPSANRSGRVSATRARHVAEDLGTSIAMVLDGGGTLIGLESTVVDASGRRAVLLRPGAVPAGDIEIVLGEPLPRAGAAGEKPSSPGQLASHYAPRAKLRLNARDKRQGEALLAFGSEPPAATAERNLSPTGNLVEAAANLFAYLREVDALGRETIAVMPVPDLGLGEAINDRLLRAAAPRL